MKTDRCMVKSILKSHLDRVKQVRAIQTQPSRLRSRQTSRLWSPRKTTTRTKAMSATAWVRHMSIRPPEIMSHLSPTKAIPTSTWRWPLARETLSHLSEIERLASISAKLPSTGILTLPRWVEFHDNGTNSSYNTLNREKKREINDRFSHSVNINPEWRRGNTARFHTQY